MAVLQLNQIESKIMSAVIDSFIGWLVGMIDWLVMVLLYARGELRPAPKVKQPYRGGYTLLPKLEVMKFQPDLFKILGTGKKELNKAIILQKLEDWITYNQQNNKNVFEGKTWAPGSRPYWVKNHFTWMTESWFGTLVKELKDDGFLFITSDPSLCSKGENAYCPNYARIKELLLQDNVSGATEQTPSPPRTKLGKVGDKLPPDKSSKTSSKNKAVKKETTTNKARAQEMTDTPKSEADDVAVVVDNHISDMDKSKIKKPSTTDNPLSAWLEQNEAETPAEPDTEKEDYIRKLMRDFSDLGEGTARNWLKDHSINRVKVVADYAKNAKTLNNPVGWIVAELRDDKLGLGDTPDTQNKYSSGEYASIINS